MAVGFWLLAIGGLRLALGRWQLAIGGLRLAIGGWLLALGGWQLAVGVGFWRFAVGDWQVEWAFSNCQQLIAKSQLPKAQINRASSCFCTQLALYLP